MGTVIHLRLTVPDDISDTVASGLTEMPGVAHLARLSGSSLKPPGDVLLVDVARNQANAVIEWLQDQGVHHRGSISIETLDAVVSDSAQVAEESSPIRGEDVLIWESLEAQARNDARPSRSFLIFIAIATIIAVVGILLDSPVLIVAAMVVGPEYGPISATCLAAARGRWNSAGAALSTLLLGLVLGLFAGALATAVFRLTGIAPSHYDLSERQLTAFISRPDALAAVVAILAGIVGMLSLTESKSNALVGVLVSVTTVPAVANAGAAAAYREWAEFSGSGGPTRHQRRLDCSWPVL
ncbi:MAG: DUF389 domain-containing protein [Microthrixaceae bacterium]